MSLKRKLQHVILPLLPPEDDSPTPQHAATSSIGANGISTHNDFELHQRPNKKQRLNHQQASSTKHEKQDSSSAQPVDIGFDHSNNEESSKFPPFPRKQTIYGPYTYLPDYHPVITTAFSPIDQFVQTIFSVLPNKVIRHILTYFAFPDFEYHTTVAAKLQDVPSCHKHVPYALSTTNQILYKTDQLLKYYYGYFHSDKERNIFLLNSSMKIMCQDTETNQSPNSVPFKEILPHFGHLQKLNLFKVSFSLDDVPLLPKQLTYFSIMTSVDMDMLVFDQLLRYLPELNALQLQAKLKDKHRIAEKVFHKMCRLKSLSILSTKISDEQASIFMNPSSNQGINNIENLSLVHCTLSSRCLDPIVHNRTLKCLRISRNPIKDVGCSKIRSCQSLLELSIDMCQVSGKGVNYVAQLPLLKRLWVRQNSISSSFGRIASAHNLQILNFHDNQGTITVSMCRAMSKCASVHTLVMNKCRLTDDHIEALLNNNTSLRRLYINWNDSLTQRAIEAIARNKSIYKLAYSQRTLNNNHLKYLLENNDVLQVLNIPYSPAVTDAFLPYLAHNKTLRTLKIRQVEHITAQGIAFIKRYCHSITQLFFGGEEREERWIREGTDPSLLQE